MSAEFDKDFPFPLVQSLTGGEDLTKLLQNRDQVTIRLNALHYAVKVVQVGGIHPDVDKDTLVAQMTLNIAAAFEKFLRKGLDSPA